jgi:hypothetical protein
VTLLTERGPHIYIYVFFLLGRMSNSDQPYKVYIVCVSEVQTVTNRYLLTDSF